MDGKSGNCSNTYYGQKAVLTFWHAVEDVAAHRTLPASFCSRPTSHFSSCARGATPPLALVRAAGAAGGCGVSHGTARGPRTLSECPTGAGCVSPPLCPPAPCRVARGGGFSAGCSWPAGLSLHGLQEETALPPSICRVSISQHFLVGFPWFLYRGGNVALSVMGERARERVKGWGNMLGIAICGGDGRSVARRLAEPVLRGTVQ